MWQGCRWSSFTEILFLRQGCGIGFKELLQEAAVSYSYCSSFFISATPLSNPLKGVFF
jgi:hypothetical protein